MSTPPVSGNDLPRVHITQPVVPHYRVPFFDALAQRFGERLCVSASVTHERGPSSAPIARAYLDLQHECTFFLGGRLLWQRNLRPQADFGPGDVAVIAGNPRYLSTFRFAYEARRRGVGVVIWTQLWSPTSTVLNAAIRLRLLRWGDAVLTYTDDEARRLQPLVGPNVTVVGAQNAVDEQALRDAREAWSPERLLDFQRTHALCDRHVLLFCGRLRSSPSSRVDVLLSAVALLAKQDPRYLAVVIGDGDERQVLEQRCTELGITGNVRWLGAQYDEGANAPWFLSALCSVYPGSIGLSMMHALGYGAPVITHSDPLQHYPEFAALRPGWNGLVFELGNAADLARQIDLLRSDERLRREVSRNALRTVSEDFSLGNMVERFILAVKAAHHRSLSRQHPQARMSAYGGR